MARRIVTGEDRDGHSYLAADEDVAARTSDLSPGATFTQIWATDSTPVAPLDGARAGLLAWFPPADGFRFFLFSLPPTGLHDGPADLGLATDQTNERLPGLLDTQFDAAIPGRHRSDTVDAMFVISGEIVLILDDGSRVTARRGDSIIQNATFHRWEVPGPHDVLLVAAAIGVHRPAG